jgi:1-acyl-sn-glycerol-3-phosphate acyltransferase
MRMPVIEWLLNSVLRALIRLLFVVDGRELDRIPRNEAVILVTNHTTNFEGPVYYLLLRGCRKTALGKRELWRNPFTRFLMQVWRIIPINRRGPDRIALHRARRSLARGELLGIAPEGTRSSSGTLQRGRAGAAMIALDARVPIVPSVQWGVQDLVRNIRRLRRTPIHFRVGAPFFLRVPDDAHPTPRQLRIMADEIMYQLAVLMPEHLRGYYRDLTRMTTTYVQRPKQ